MCATFALKKAAQDGEQELGPAAANFLQQDFYVANGLTSCPTIEEANQLIGLVKEMCKREGFNLQKFVSKKKEVLKSIPVAARAEDLKNIIFDPDKPPTEPALSVRWCIKSDTFKFNVALQDCPCTGRGILSTINF